MSNEIIEWKGDKVTVDLKKAVLLAEEGGKITTTPDAEKALLAILAIQELGEQLGVMAKEKLLVAIDQLREKNPKLTSITSPNINVRYQSYGGRYKLDQSENMGELRNKNLVKLSTSYSPIADAIDEHRERFKQLPQGITEPERPKVLSFRKKKKEIELPF